MPDPVPPACPRRSPGTRLLALVLMVLAALVALQLWTSRAQDQGAIDQRRSGDDAHSKLGPGNSRRTCNVIGLFQLDGSAPRGVQLQAELHCTSSRTPAQAIEVASDGSFATLVPSIGDWKLICWLSGSALTARRFSLSGESVHDLGTIKLLGEDRLTVMVIGQDGEPVPHTSVRIVASNSQSSSSRAGALERAVACDPSGRSEHARLPAGDYVLIVLMAGIPVLQQQASIPCEEQPIVLAIPNLSDLTGVVISESGVPIQATVDLLPVDGTEFLESKVVESGEFSFSRLSRSIPWRVRARSAGDARIAERTVDLYSQSHVTLRLSHGIRLCGRVTGPTGDAIPGALLRLSVDGRPWVSASRTSDDGTYLLPVVPWGESIVVLAKRSQSGLEHRFELGSGIRTERDETIHRFDMVLPDVRCVRGRAVDQEGNLVPNVKAILLRIEGGELFQRLECATDPAGRFEFIDVPNGRWLLTAAGEELYHLWDMQAFSRHYGTELEGSGDVITFHAESVSVEHDIVMAAKSKISGRVVRHSGASAIGARVRVAEVQRDSLWLERIVDARSDSKWHAVDDNGEFSVLASPDQAGAKLVAVSPDGCVGESGVIGNIDVYADSFVTIALTDGVLRGIVVDGDDRRVSGAEIRVHDEGETLRRLTVDDRAAVYTNEDGEFLIQTMAPSSAVLMVRHAEYQTTLVECSLGHSAVIRLGTGRTVTGRVMDSQNAPVLGCTVRLIPTSDPRFGGVQDVEQVVETGPDGLFTFVNVPQEACRVSVVDWEWSSIGSVTVGPFESEVVLRARSMRSLVGTVTRADGSPAAWAEVVVHSPLENSEELAAHRATVGKIVSRSRANASGEFSVRVSDQGGEFLVVHDRDAKVAHGLRGASRVVELSSQPQSGLSITLERGSVIDGAVRLEDGGGFSGDVLFIERLEGSERFGSISVSMSSRVVNGVFRLDGLSGRLGTVRVREQGMEVLSASLRPERGVILTVPAGARIAGRVKWLDGRSAARVTVFASRKEGGMRWTESAADGTFSMSGLPAGTYSLAAESTGQEGAVSSDRATLELARGQSEGDIVLTLESKSR